jgi:tRNA(Ile)-lysidine synthase
MNPLTKIRTFIKTNHLFSKGERIVLGVSGGPDSVFLLYALYQLRHELGLSLIVAHINHHLRIDSTKDGNFVKKLCHELSLPFAIRDVRILKRKGQSSIEEIARQKRFNAFIEIAKKYHSRKIALGHNLDDLAETVLMRILRGTGLSGMRAILPQRQISGMTFTRPILDISHHEIMGFLKSKKLPFRLDPTNTSL